MIKNNTKKAINFLNTMSLSDARSAYRLLYLISECNPHAIIRASEKYKFETPKEKTNDDIAIECCNTVKSHKLEAIRLLRNRVNISLTDARDLINKYFKS